MVGHTDPSWRPMSGEKFCSRFRGWIFLRRGDCNDSDVWQLWWWLWTFVIMAAWLCDVVPRQGWAGLRVWLCVHFACDDSHDCVDILLWLLLILWVRQFGPVATRNFPSNHSAAFDLTSFFILLTILSFTSKRIIKRAPTNIRDTRTIPVHWVQLGIAEHDLFTDPAIFWDLG